MNGYKIVNQNHIHFITPHARRHFRMSMFTFINEDRFIINMLSDF